MDGPTWAWVAGAAGAVISVLVALGASVGSMLFSRAFGWIPAAVAGVMRSDAARQTAIEELQRVRTEHAEAIKVLTEQQSRIFIVETKVTNIEVVMVRMEGKVDAAIAGRREGDSHA